MSQAYDNYLMNHKENVILGFEWLHNNLPEIFDDINVEELTNKIITNHDSSKYDIEEYEAYDNWFYGVNNKSYEDKMIFNRAWLHHIHNNPHHWQYWILNNDDPKEGQIVLPMDYEYIIEMICDWWSFSWNKNNLFEIFSWYENKKNWIQLNQETKEIVESILRKMLFKLLEMNMSMDIKQTNDIANILNNGNEYNN